MKKIFSKLMVFGLAIMALASCSEPGDEITEINYKRNFSPTNFEAKVRNRTNVELSWTLGEGVTNYIIEMYENDNLTFAGTPTTYNVTSEQMPYLVTYLNGETDYSFRIKAVTEGDSNRDSKWSAAHVKTDSEQIMQAVKEEDIEPTAVTLRWAAGQEAATITLNPGNIVYNVTSADIAAGAAHVTGLTPETNYTAVLARSDGRIRGTAKFTTGVVLEPTDILVKTGTDLATAIANAPAGYRLVIEPGTYPLANGETTSGAAIKISKDITLKGLKLNDHPVIVGRFQVEANLKVSQVTLDGKDTDGGQAFDYTADGNIDYLTVEKSEIQNYTKGFFYLNKATLIDKITIEECIIRNIECSGGDFFDSRKGGYNTFDLKNNTIYESAKERDIFRMDDASGSISAKPVITADHNTFYNVGSANANYRVFYVRFKGNKITFTNNLVVGTNYKRGFANNGNTDKDPTLDNNVYFNTENLISAGASADATITWFDTQGTVLDPKFKDAANGDFTIDNDNVKDKKVGDPRWL
jgi:hypothetical protein